MSITDQRKATHEMIEDLIDKLETSNIHSDMNSKLELNSDNEHHNRSEVPKTPNRELHSAIFSMKTFPHIKGKKYTIDQLKELEEILVAFPDHHLTI